MLNPPAECHTHIALPRCPKCRTTILAIQTGDCQASKECPKTFAHVMTHTRKRGSGVGLMMVHNIVQAHEDTAHGISSEGKTSTFIFTFLRIRNIEMPKSIPMRLAQRGSQIMYWTWLCIRVSRRPLLAEKLLRHHAPGQARPASARAAARTLGCMAPCVPVRRAHSAWSTTISGRSSSLCVPPGCCPGCSSGWWRCTTSHRRPTAGAAHPDTDMGGQVRHDRLCRDEMPLTPGARPATERSLERRAVAMQ
jgi:hypothetical protein